eukprot:609731-Pyramimonas_sp.AAC.1
MGLFPSSYHSDTAQIMAAAWALAWIAQASLGTVPITLRLDAMRSLGVLMGSHNFEVSNSGLIHEGERYNELTDTVARLTGMGLMLGMDFMPFVGLMFDSSALAWAWLYEKSADGLPCITVLTT